MSTAEFLSSDDPLSLLGLGDDDDGSTETEAPTTQDNESTEDAALDDAAPAIDGDAGYDGAPSHGVDEASHEADGSDAAEDSTPVPAPVRLDAERAEVLDIVASLVPVLRAVQVFPGPGASIDQSIKCIRMLSQDSVRIADQLARESDPKEIDLGWRRRRAGVLTAEIVADHWISTVIKNQGVASEDMWPSEGIGRLTAAFLASVETAREMPAVSGGEVDIYAAALALAPVLVDLQRMAWHLAANQPDVVVDVDSAALALATTVCEEVATGVERLLPFMPVGSSAVQLSSELMARSAQLVQSALAEARGEFYSELKAVEHDMAAYERIVAIQLQGGLPVAATCEKVRTMMRRLVGMSVYACQSISGGNA
ncbi:hypothetical protein [Pseudoxanthomonas kaohsiungensis]|uniref:Uncharacterized protein n=1 Tax=Pseudoxanthomonas kaohsiungensis TaxID=283923 RepID=A0ABW3M2A1_9GAMM|nr:hypothetical protein [Pseudoxanthomonas kaohsiungensis]